MFFGLRKILKGPTGILDGTVSGEVQQYDENDDQVFVFYLKDRAVYSLNVTEAFATGITRPSENRRLKYGQVKTEN